jgi:hypothetical protein
MYDVRPYALFRGSFCLNHLNNTSELDRGHGVGTTWGFSQSVRPSSRDEAKDPKRPGKIRDEAPKDPKRPGKFAPTHNSRSVAVASLKIMSFHRRSTLIL